MEYQPNQFWLNVGVVGSIYPEQTRDTPKNSSFLHGIKINKLNVKQVSIKAKAFPFHRDKCIYMHINMYMRYARQQG